MAEVPQDEEEPMQENSEEEGYEEGQPVDLKNDEVEGTRDFNAAYDKLVKKFYHEEGANLLIPEEDMMIHEYNQMNKVKVNVEERQKRIEEQQRKKEDKIR